jgi:hypothetical protein
MTRLIIAIVMVFILVSVLSWLQGRYDDSDHRKSQDIVRRYRAIPNGPSIPEAILARHPGVREHDLSWSSEITSGCLGHVRVYAYIPKKDSRPAKTYAFDVKLTAPSIHPTDPETVEILKSLTIATSSVTTSTAAAI